MKKHNILQKLEQDRASFIQKATEAPVSRMEISHIDLLQNCQNLTNYRKISCKSVEDNKISKNKQEFNDDFRAG